MGGAERVCLSIIGALRQEGDIVTMLTIDKTDWKKITDRFSNDIRPDIQLSARNFRMTEVNANFARSSVIALDFLLFLRRKIKVFDIVVNTYGDFEPLNTFADITYSGLPFSMSSQYPYLTPYPIKNRVVQKAYCLANCVTKFQVLKKHPLILANSKFTEGLIKEAYGTHIVTEVLNPPCNVRDATFPINLSHKQNIVLTVSRFAFGKRLDLVPDIAKRAKNWTFIIVGSTSEISSVLIKHVREKIKLFGLECRVILMLNASKDKLQEVLSMAKVYLHLTESEPFGISIVEAMAHGCVPVVHKSGGPWYDILDRKQDYFGYGYDKYEEIADYLMMLENEEAYRVLSLRAQKRSTDFSEEIFRRKFTDKFRKILMSKGVL